VSKNTSVIEINGNRYDAVTGQLVGVVKKMTGQVSPASRVMDGFIKKPADAKIFSKHLSKLPAKKVVANSAGRQPQKSQTLMRSAVAKYAEARTAISGSQSKAHSLRPKPGRIVRAETVPKNSKVHRFGGPLFAARSIMKNTPVVGQVMPRAGGSATASSSAMVAASAQPLPNLVASLSPHHLERLLDEALTRADYHKDLLRRQLAGNSPWGRIKLMSRWLSLGVSFLVVMLLAGFFAWQNIPQVSMRMAASQTHVSATVPSYRPSGFSFAAPVSHSDKAVTIKYQAGANSAQNYSVTQQNSNWDSTTLAASVGSKSAQVQTSQVNGTTVYIYGTSNNASWVNHGVLSTLNNQADLSSDQILEIAGSMQ
jgi:hypothetical protein